MFGETAEGWLSKSGLLIGLSTSRHRRYCILSGNELRYYKQKTDTRPAGTIDLKHYRIAEKDSGKQHPFGFRIVSQCKNHRSYIFYADHEQGCQSWIDIINATLDPFIGKHHTCDAPVLSPQPPQLHEENYSVLDKWLNRLDLNDHPNSPPSGPPPPGPSSSSLSSTYHSSTTTTASRTLTNTTSASNNATIASSFSSYLSPTLRPYRTSTESLDSIPSETTLSSSAGSRAQLSNTIFTPPTNKGNYHPPHHQQHQQHHQHHPSSYYHQINSPPTQYQTPTSANKRLSNPIAILSNFKQQYSIRTNQQPGDSNKNPPQPWTNNSKVVSSSRKDWESEELFDFEDEMLYSTDLLRDAGTHAPPPPLS